MCQPLVAQGEFAQVKFHVQQALGMTGEWVGDHDLYALLADIAAQERDLAGLEAYTAHAEATSAQAGHMLYQGVAARARGILLTLQGNFIEAEEHLNRSYSILANLGTRWQIGRTLYELGSAAATQGNHTKAKELFTSALAEFEQLGAAPDAAKTKRQLMSLDGDDGP
jgi:tetratricopeptide (TPR) repeat protein